MLDLNKTHMIIFADNLDLRHWCPRIACFLAGGEGVRRRPFVTRSLGKADASVVLEFTNLGMEDLIDGSDPALDLDFYLLSERKAIILADNV
jgi:hypothetical protein